MLCGMTDVLDVRSLNRATLARQLLLERSAMTPVQAVERLVGLQAQTPHSWYYGLASRLAEVRPEQVSDLLVGRQVVRIALMRGTIHLVTAQDCRWLRPSVQALIERLTQSTFGKRLQGLERAEVAAAGRALVEERPLTPAQLGRRLAERWPDHDPDVLAQAVRAWVPLVQVPPRGVWGRSGPMAHTSAEAWLGTPLRADPAPEELVLRGLAAFGPASVRDLQMFSGVTRLRAVVDRLRPRLLAFRDEQGTELFDLPDAPRPDSRTPAPIRFLYDFDNLLLSYADRSRILTPEYWAQPYARNVVPSALLIDGFTNGTWKLVRNRNTACLVVKAFRPLTRAERAELEAEAERTLTFAAADADDHELRIIPPDAPEMPWMTAT
jgi:winged helix DNA-binding protein